MIAALVRPLVDDPRGGPWLLLAVVWLLAIAAVVAVALAGVVAIAVLRRSLWRLLAQDPTIVAIAFVVDAPGGTRGGKLLDGVGAPPGQVVEVVPGRGVRRLVKREGPHG